MQLNIHHLTAITLFTLPTLILAADPVQIKFCNDQSANSICITEDIEFNKCKLIPDSNAKGDNGSFVKVRSKNIPLLPNLNIDLMLMILKLLGLKNFGDISCTLYKNDVCWGGNSTPIYNEYKMHDQGGIIFRSYKCED